MLLANLGRRFDLAFAMLPLADGTFDAQEVLREPGWVPAYDVSLTPCVPQSTRPRPSSTDMKRRLRWMETSPCPPGQTIDASSRGLLALSMS